MSVNIYFGLAVVVTILQTAQSSECSLKYKNEIRYQKAIYVAARNGSEICSIGIDQNNSTYTHDDVRIFFRLYNRDTYNWTVGLKSLSYNSQNASIFFIAHNVNHKPPRRVKVGMMTLDAAQPKITLVFDTKNFITDKRDVKSTAYDYASKNLYITNGNSIWVLNVFGTQSSNIKKIFHNGVNIQKLAVHPNRGFLFFVADGMIYRSHLDGSDEHVILENFGSSLIDLIVDTYDDTLYWSTAQKIGHATLNGTSLANATITEELSLPTTYSTHPIAVDERFIYHRPPSSNSIFRFFKGNITRDESFELINEKNTEIIDIVIRNPWSQLVNTEQPCKDQSNDYFNNGCDSFCFAVPEGGKLSRKCACGSDYELHSDGRACIYIHDD